MLETHQMPAPVRGQHAQPLIAGQELKAVVNLRGDARDPAFLPAVQQALGLGLQTPISLRYWMVSPIAVRTGWEPVGLANRWLQIDRSGPFLPSFCPTARLSGYKSGKNWGRWGRFSL